MSNRSSFSTPSSGRKSGQRGLGGVGATRARLISPQASRIATVAAPRRSVSVDASASRISPGSVAAGVQSTGDMFVKMADSMFDVQKKTADQYMRNANNRNGRQLDAAFTEFKDKNMMNPEAFTAENILPMFDKVFGKESQREDFNEAVSDEVREGLFAIYEGELDIAALAATDNRFKAGVNESHDELNLALAHVGADQRNNPAGLMAGMDHWAETTESMIASASHNPEYQAGIIQENNKTLMRYIDGVGKGLIDPASSLVDIEDKGEVYKAMVGRARDEFQIGYDQNAESKVDATISNEFERRTRKANSSANINQHQHNLLSEGTTNITQEEVSLLTPENGIALELSKQVFDGAATLKRDIAEAQFIGDPVPEFSMSQVMKNASSAVDENSMILSLTIQGNTKLSRLSRIQEEHISAKSVNGSLDLMARDQGYASITEMINSGKDLPGGDVNSAVMLIEAVNDMGVTFQDLKEFGSAEQFRAIRGLVERNPDLALAMGRQEKVAALFADTAVQNQVDPLKKDNFSQGMETKAITALAERMGRGPDGQAVVNFVDIIGSNLADGKAVAEGYGLSGTIYNRNMVLSDETGKMASQTIASVAGKNPANAVVAIQGLNSRVAEVNNTGDDSGIQAAQADTMNMWIQMSEHQEPDSMMKTSFELLAFAPDMAQNPEFANILQAASMADNPQGRHAGVQGILESLQRKGQLGEGFDEEKSVTVDSMSTLLLRDMGAEDLQILEGYSRNFASMSGADPHQALYNLSKLMVSATVIGMDSNTSLADGFTEAYLNKIKLVGNSSMASFRKTESGSDVAFDRNKIDLQVNSFLPAEGNRVAKDGAIETASGGLSYEGNEEDWPSDFSVSLDKVITGTSNVRSSQFFGFQSTTQDPDSHAWLGNLGAAKSDIEFYSNVLEDFMGTSGLISPLINKFQVAFDNEQETADAPSLMKDLGRPLRLAPAAHESLFGNPSFNSKYGLKDLMGAELEMKQDMIVMALFQKSIIENRFAQEGDTFVPQVSDLPMVFDFEGESISVNVSSGGGMFYTDKNGQVPFSVPDSLLYREFSKQGSGVFNKLLTPSVDPVVPKNKSQQFVPGVGLVSL